MNPISVECFHTVLYCRKWDECVSFYRNILGLEVKKEEGVEYAVVRVPGALHFGIWSRASAAEHVKGEAKDGALNLDHVVAYNKEVEDTGCGEGRVAPAIIPDYTDPRVRERQLTANYVGNVR